MSYKFNTVLLLMAEYGKTMIPLKEISEKYLGLTPKTAHYRAKDHQLPFNTFQVGNNAQAPRMVHIEDLALFIEKQQKEAQNEWDKMNC